jgi:hypothetical protein
MISGPDGGLDRFVHQTLHRSGRDRLPAHLEERSGIRIRATSELDVGVLRVDRLDGPSWVARVFPPARPREAVEGDARILQALERQGFPTERRRCPSLRVLSMVRPPP